MKADLSVERTAPRSTSPDDASICNIVILYDDVAAGQRAMGTLTALTGKLRNDRVQMRPHLWRFDLLQDADWFALALADAINADMLILATSSASGLPTTAENWLKLCLARKRGTEGAVVALLTGTEHAGESDSRGFRFVQCMAKDAGLDFFIPRLCQEALDAATGNIHHQTTTATLGGILPPDERPRLNRILSQIYSYQHWGLNE